MALDLWTGCRKVSNEGRKELESSFQPEQCRLPSARQVSSIVSYPDHLTGGPRCDSLLISELSVRLNMLQIAASSPLHTAVVFGSLVPSRSADMTRENETLSICFMLWLPAAITL